MLTRNEKEEEMRMLRRLTVATGATIALLGALGAPATAAAPANRGCLGQDFREYAQAGRDLGAFLSGLASSTGGLGTEVNAHLAGEIPDSVIPNTCND